MTTLDKFLIDCLESNQTSKQKAGAIIEFVALSPDNIMIEIIPTHPNKYKRLEAERRLIKELRPSFNIIHNE